MTPYKKTKPAENIIAAFTDNNISKYELFEKTLAESRFFEILDRQRVKSGKAKKDFKIVIKPNITMLLRRNDDGVYTDPCLTIHLLRLLLNKGYSNLAVVESQNFYAEWFTNRAVIQIAARAGYFDESVLHEYKGERKKDIVVKGGGVDAAVSLVDLTLDMVKYDFRGDTGKIDLGKTWIDADFRINFAKMKTHFYCYYTLAIKNIYGCLPLQDKVKEYHCKQILPQWTARLIKEFPVDFSIIDGYTSADGMQGAKMKALSFKSHTFVAGADILAVDHFTAGLMKQKPGKSVMYTELEKIMPSKPYTVTGNAKPFKGWRNPKWHYVKLTQSAQGSDKAMEFLGYILTGGYDDCFPMKKDERSLIKKILTSPKYIGNFFTDIENTKVKLREKYFRKQIAKHKDKMPAIATSDYILSRLVYFSAADIERLVALIEAGIKNKLTISGHFIIDGKKETAFPARLCTTNLAAADILNYAKDKNFLADIKSELKTILTLNLPVFRREDKYPYCYK